jgi:hypothetical protein
MIKKTVTACMLLAVAFTYAQKSPVTAGGEATGSGGTSSYSIGQLAYANIATDKLSENQGIQQAYEIMEVTEKTALLPSRLEFTVYPNPTEDVVNVAIANYEQEKVSYQLISATGQLLIATQASEDTTPISMKNAAAGIYFIQVIQNEQPIKTFKIIKH